MRRGGRGEGDSCSLSVDTGRRGKHELGRYCGSDLRGVGAWFEQSSCVYTCAGWYRKCICTCIIIQPL